MRDPDQGVVDEILRQKNGTFETRRKARLIGDWTNACITTQIHQKVGVVIPFSCTADKDPNQRIPLSVPDYRPVLMLEAAAWAAVALAVGLAYWWVA